MSFTIPNSVDCFHRNDFIADGAIELTQPIENNYSQKYSNKYAIYFYCQFGSINNCCYESVRFIACMHALSYSHWPRSLKEQRRYTTNDECIYECTYIYKYSDVVQPINNIYIYIYLYDSALAWQRHPNNIDSLSQQKTSFLQPFNDNFWNNLNIHMYDRFLSRQHFNQIIIVIVFYICKLSLRITENVRHQNSISMFLLLLLLFRRVLAVHGHSHRNHESYSQILNTMNESLLPARLAPINIY